jgi:hypothetical protein
MTIKPFKPFTPITLETIARTLLPSPSTDRVLAPSERRTLALAADAILEGASSSIDIDVEEVARNVERFIGAPTSRRAWRVRVLLTLFEVAPILSIRWRLKSWRSRPFSRMTRDERIAFVNARLAHEPNHIWAICSRIRPLVYLGTYASPSARQAVGFIEVGDRRSRSRFAKKAATRRNVVRLKVAS